MTRPLTAHKLRAIVVLSITMLLALCELASAMRSSSRNNGSTTLLNSNQIGWLRCEETTSNLRGNIFVTDTLFLLRCCKLLSTLTGIGPGTYLIPELNCLREGSTHFVLQGIEYMLECNLGQPGTILTKFPAGFRSR